MFFLSSEFPPAPASNARFHILPAPMECGVSYGRGTANGPAAILEASQQLEAFDGHSSPGGAGIYTAPAVMPAANEPEAWLDAIERVVASSLTCHNAVPILLGGEHTVTLGAARAFKKAGREIGFLHFDAHADLRDTYEGSPFSHACVMRRVHELGFPIVQIATRAYSREEHDYRAAHPQTLRAFDAETLVPFVPSAPSVPFVPSVPFIPSDFPKHIYVSFDVDAWDPSLMPATGTPVPGGLDWFGALRILQSALKGRILAAADVVELAPIPSLPHASFTAARMVYALMGLAQTGM